MAKISEDRTEDATGSEVTKMISGTKLKKLLRDQRTGQDSMDEIRGTMGNAVKQVVEKDNLDKKMFGWVKQLDRMTPEKLAYHLPNFLYMLDASGLSARAEDAKKLPLGDEEESEGHGRKITPFPKPSSVAAE